jgi:hypothetical protein
LTRRRWLMRTLYLDHNVVHYFVRGFPKNGRVSEPAEREALEVARRMSPDMRFAISDWNLVEPSWETDPKVSPELLMSRYAAFLMGLRPLYLPSHRSIERAEMRQVVYAHLDLPSTARPVPVFNETFSQVCAVDQIHEIYLDYDIERHIVNLARNRESREGIRRAQQTVLKAQLDIALAKERGLYGRPDLELELHRQWFRSLMPDRGPDDQALLRGALDTVAERLAGARGPVFRACPAIWSESVLAEVRANVGGRKPQIQDGIDFMHTILPLAYCDAFVSADAHLRRCAAGVIKITGRNVVVAKTLSEAMQKLRGA